MMEEELEKEEKKKKNMETNKVKIVMTTEEVKAEGCIIKEESREEGEESSRGRERKEEWGKEKEEINLL